MKTLLRISMFLMTIIWNGCDPYASRECPGFNYDIEKWLNYDDIDTLKYSDNNGKELIFIKYETVISEASEQGRLGTKDPEDIICELFAIFRYGSIVDSVILEIEFMEREEFEMPEDKEVVFLTYQLIDSTTDRIINGHSFKIESFEVYEDFGQSYMEELEINGVIYSDVVMSSRDTTHESFLPSFDFWQVSVAKSNGIIQMTNRLGETYYIDE